LHALLLNNYQPPQLTPLLLAGKQPPATTDLGASPVVPPGPGECYLAGGSRPPGGLYVKKEGASPGPGEQQQQHDFAPSQPHLHAQGWNTPFG